MRFEELTGHEIEAVETELGEPLAAAAERGSLMTAYAIYWIERRRTEPAYTYDQAKSLSMEDVAGALNTEDPVPKVDAGNGAASPASAVSGA